MNGLNHPEDRDYRDVGGLPDGPSTFIRRGLEAVRGVARAAIQLRDEEVNILLAKNGVHQCALIRKAIGRVARDSDEHQIALRLGSSEQPAERRSQSRRTVQRLLDIESDANIVGRNLSGHDARLKVGDH